MYKKNGFTLVELLAVIVILAIIMIIAIPAVLDTMTTAKKNAFIEYIDKIGNETEKTSLSNELLSGSQDKCVIYNIKTDLGLSSTGNYEGYSIIDNDSVYIVSIHDDEYMVNGIKYGSKIDTDSLEVYDSSKASKFTVSSICDLSSCNSCITSKSEADSLGVSYDEIGSSGKVKISSRVISKKVNEKDYIEYLPSITSYDVDTTLTNALSVGTINPSLYKKWRVFKKNDDGSIDIIPVSTNFGQINFKGSVGYANFIYVLNRAAESFINPDYAVKARSYGFNGKSTEMITDFSKINSTSRPCYYSAPENLGCGDKEGRYNKDYVLYNKLFYPERTKTNPIIDVDTRNAWVASRDNAESSAKAWMWRAYSIDGSYALNGSYFFSYSLDTGFSESSSAKKIYPVVTIKSDVLISDGDGTKTNPYKLSLE